MKHKRIKKLTLKKSTLVNLNDQGMSEIKGGFITEPTVSMGSGVGDTWQTCDCFTMVREQCPWTMFFDCPTY